MLLGAKTLVKSTTFNGSGKNVDQKLVNLKKHKTTLSFSKNFSHQVALHMLIQTTLVKIL
jgi:hypothetical protein